MVYTRRASYTSVDDVCTELGLNMGKVYDLSADSGDSQPNPERVYVGTNYSEHFSIGQSIQIAEYADTGVDRGDPLKMEYGVVSNTGTDYIVLSSELDNDYLTANNAGIRSLALFNEVTSPRWGDIDTSLLEIEDQIDHITHNSWSQRVHQKTYSYHKELMNHRRSVRRGGSAKRGMYNWRAINLDISDVLELDDTIDTAYDGYTGDSIRIWDSEEWVEIFNPANPLGADSVDIWTIGREDKYYISYEEGNIVFVDDTPMYGNNVVKVRMRFGQEIAEQNDAPGMRDISRAAKYFAMMDLYQNPLFKTNLPGNADGIAGQQRIADWKKKAYDILRRHKKLYYS